MVDLTQAPDETVLIGMHQTPQAMSSSSLASEWKDGEANVPSTTTV